MLAGLSGDLMEVCWDMLRQVSGFLFRCCFFFVLKFVLFLTMFFFSYTCNFNFAIEDHIRACLDYGSMTGIMHQTHAALGASAQWWRHMMVMVEHLERTGVDIYLPRVSPFMCQISTPKRSGFGCFFGGPKFQTRLEHLGPLYEEEFNLTPTMLIFGLVMSRLNSLWWLRRTIPMCFLQLVQALEICVEKSSRCWQDLKVFAICPQGFALAYGKNLREFT